MPDSTAPAVDASLAGCSWLAGVTVDDVQALASINSRGDEISPFLTEDGSTLYFGSDRAGGLGGYDVYFAARTEGPELFGPPENYRAVNTSSHDSSLTLASGGRAAFIATTRPGGLGGWDIWVAVRPALDRAFDNRDFSSSDALNSASHDYDPRPAPDGLTLYYSTQNVVASRSGPDLVYAVRPTLDAPFGKPLPLVGALNDQDTRAANPTLSADGLVLVFSMSSAPGYGSSLWYATRAKTDAPFSTPREVPGTNVTGTETDPFLRGDGCELYFGRRGAAAADLYSARVTPAETMQ